MILLLTFTENVGFYHRINRQLDDTPENASAHDAGPNFNFKLRGMEQGLPNLQKLLRKEKYEQASESGTRHRRGRKCSKYELSVKGGNDSIVALDENDGLPIPDLSRLSSDLDKNDSIENSFNDLSPERVKREYKASSLDVFKNIKGNDSKNTSVLPPQSFFDEDDW